MTADVQLQVAVVADVQRQEVIVANDVELQEVAVANDVELQEMTAVVVCRSRPGHQKKF